MAEIRLSKLTRQFNIGLATLVDFLAGKGVTVNMDPNAKISDEYLPMIENKFGEEQKLKQDSEKVAIKLKEIIERGTKKKNADAEDDDEPVQEIIIKSTSIAPETSAPKVETPADQQPADTAEKAAAGAEKPADNISVPEKEGQQEDTGFPKFKVVDKIDLSRFEKHPKKEEKKEQPAPQPENTTKPEERPSAQAPAETVIAEPAEKKTVNEDAVPAAEDTAEKKENAAEER